MIKIKNTVQKLIAKKNVHEQCGIVAGTKGKLLKVYDCVNKSKIQNAFKIGWIDKLKIFFDLVRNGYEFYALFHVHKNGLGMSQKDVDLARVGSYNIIVCNRKMKIFKVVKNAVGTKLHLEMDYQIIK